MADTDEAKGNPGASNDPFIRFNPPVDAKSAFLEREANILEVLNFIESATYYIWSGFRNNPPATGSYIHLLPLSNAIWWQALEAAGIREKYLPEIMEMIKIEAESRNPLHARRIKLLKVRKTSSHSDFLRRLERSMEVCEWKKMTPDKFLIHLFAEASDQYM